MKITKRTVGAVLAAGSLLLAGCSSSTGTSASTPGPGLYPPATSSAGTGSGPASGPASPALVVTIKDMAYAGPASVSPGATVTVKNQDPMSHTVTSDTSGQFDVTIPAGQSATFTAPKTAGSYAYHCTFHADMHGTLVVR